MGTMIHWLNRMPVRLVLSMVAVSLMSIVMMFLSTNFVVQKQFVRIEPEIRNQLTEAFKSDPNALLQPLERVSPTPFYLPRPLIFPKMEPSYTPPPFEVRRKDPEFSPSSTRRFRRIIENSKYREELLQTIGVSALASMIFGAVLALLLARRIAHPLVAVSYAATEIAEGNLGARAQLKGLKIRGQDEASTLARNFNDMAATLEKLESERKNMIADIAHELRTPLTILQSRMDAFEDGIVPLNLEEVGKLSIQTQLLTRLVEDLRILSLADAGRLSIRKQTLDLHSLLEHILSDFSERFSSKGIEVHFVTEARVTLKADPDRLTQVLVNLFENALRHTPQGGWIRLELKRLSQEVQLILTDSGSGITPQNLDKVFNRFFRESQERNRETGGTGLGLAIVKALLELQGGKVEARNAKGAGAQFWISFSVPVEHTS